MDEVERKSALLSNRNLPLRSRAIVYQACIRSVLLYAAETWALSGVVRSCDRRMLRRLCGISLRDRISSDEVLRRCKLEDIELVLRKKRLVWFGHVKRRDENDPLSRVQEVVVPGRRPRGRSKKTWQECFDQDLQELEIPETLTTDREEWKAVKNHLTSSRQGTRRC